MTDLRSLTCVTTLLSLLLAAPTTLLAAAQATPEITPMTPDGVSSYDQVRPEADYIKRIVMIPMRNGGKLYTVIVIMTTVTI